MGRFVMKAAGAAEANKALGACEAFCGKSDVCTVCSVDCSLGSTSVCLLRTGSLDSSGLTAAQVWGLAGTGTGTGAHGSGPARTESEPTQIPAQRLAPCWHSCPS